MSGMFPLMNSEYYKSVKTPVLEGMWRRERDRVAALASPSSSDFADLYAMRSELERRRGVRLPSVDVNFEKYVSD